MKCKRFFRAFLGLAAAMTLLCSASCLAGETEVLLPDGVHSIRIPQEMSYQAPSQDETDLKGIYLLPPDLELEIFAYEAGDMTVQTLAETLVSAGRTAEVRRIGETDFLVFQDQDEADGAFCIGYGYLHGGFMVELSFFYSSQSAMDLTKMIMESFHE